MPNTLAPIDLVVASTLVPHLGEVNSPFRLTAFSKADELDRFLDKRSKEINHWILILSDNDLEAYHASGNWREELMAGHGGGVILISNHLESALNKWGKKLSVLDVRSEKDLKANHSSLLAQAVSQLERWKAIRAMSTSPYSLKRLNEIFLMLSAERDPKQLLATCLRESVAMTSATSGVLYQIEERDGELTFVQRFLCYKGQKPTDEPRNIKIIENSLCGYVTLTAKPIITADVSRLKSLAVPTYNRNVDFSEGDEIHSLLTVPFRNRRNENIAVIQLCNKVNGDAVAQFGNEDENLVASLGTQTATCLETVELYEDVQRLFDGFVKASISAIESRDPSTGGHSERVARLCVALAKATTECDTGIYRSVRFRDEEMRELEYAALLHDFGKIGVREEVLVKAKKLYPHQIGLIQERIRLGRAIAQMQMFQKGGKENKQAEAEYQKRLAELDAFWAKIQKLNEPGKPLSPEDYKMLTRIRAESLQLEGTTIPLLSTEEFEALSIESGSLTESERLEIESHVRHTYQYLKMIPWTKDFRHLTEIAYCHHEKLDGTGYPRGLLSHEIPLQSKIMTIADIYDALTSADRWYKEAMPVEKALNILHAEVAEGKIDPVLFELFNDKKLYLLTQSDITRFGT